MKFKPLKPYIKKIFYYPLEAVSRYSDPQLQVGENYPYLLYLKPTIF